MKCLFAIKSLEFSKGGAERVFTSVVNGLIVRGHHITVLTWDRPDSEAFYPLDSRADWVQLGIGRVDRSTTFREMVKRIGTTRRTMSVHEPEVVVAFMHSMFIPLGLAMIGTGIPMIASEHIVTAYYAKHPLQRALLRLTPYLAQRITVVSEQAMAQYPAALQADMVVMPNLVQAHTMSVTRADAAGANRPRKILLAVGRLAEEKDHATLIKAFALIASRLPNWDLRIVGDGKLRDFLQRLIAAVGLEGRVSLPGATKDVGSEYTNAQLFVMPSLYESEGLALIEALALGLPAVGFADCPGVNRLIQPGWNGVLVSGPNRVHTLAEALERLMTDERARLNLIPSEAVPLGVTDPDVVLNLWEDLLNDALRT